MLLIVQNKKDYEMKEDAIRNFFGFWMNDKDETSFEKMEQELRDLKKDFGIGDFSNNINVEIE